MAGPRRRYLDGSAGNLFGMFDRPALVPGRARMNCLDRDGLVHTSHKPDTVYKELGEDVPSVTPNCKYEWWNDDRGPFTETPEPITCLACLAET